MTPSLLPPAHPARPVPSSLIAQWQEDKLSMLSTAKMLPRLACTLPPSLRVVQARLPLRHAVRMFSGAKVYYRTYTEDQLGPGEGSAHQLRHSQLAPPTRPARSFETPAGLLAITLASQCSLQHTAVLSAMQCATQARVQAGCSGDAHGTFDVTECLPCFTPSQVPKLAVPRLRISRTSLPPFSMRR